MNLRIMSNLGIEYVPVEFPYTIDLLYDEHLPITFGPFGRLSFRCNATDRLSANEAKLVPQLYLENLELDMEVEL